jgi:hypothetical protein
VAVNGGHIRAKNSVVYSNHVDPVGFALMSMKRAVLEMILIESTEETTR